MSEMIKDNNMNKINFRDFFDQYLLIPDDVNLGDIGGDWLEDLYFIEGFFCGPPTKRFLFNQEWEDYFDFSDLFSKETCFYLKDLKKINFNVKDGSEKFEVKFNQSFFTSLHKILRKEVEGIKEKREGREVCNWQPFEQVAAYSFDFLEKAKEQSVFEISRRLDLEMVKYYYDKDVYLLDLDPLLSDYGYKIVLNEFKKASEILTIFAKEKPGVFIMQLTNDLYRRTPILSNLVHQQKTIMKFYARKFMYENPDSKNVFLIKDNLATYCD